MNLCLSSSNIRKPVALANILRVLQTSWILALGFIGCSDQSDVATSSGIQTDKERLTQLRIESREDLRRLLGPAIGTNDIVNAFGTPHWIERLSDDEFVWRYGLPAFPADDDMRGSYVAGVAIGITNGHLAYWTPVYVDVPGGRNVRKEEVQPSARTDGESGLAFFIVTSNSVGDGRFIDTEHFPRLGFISRIPNLTVTNLEQVTLEERSGSGPDGRNRTAWTFGIFLTKADAVELRSITATNISRKLLIMIGNEPVSAPTIVAPLEDGGVALECGDRQLMEGVKRQLAHLKRIRQ